MTFPLRVALCLGMLALCLAIPKEREVRWCAKSKSEMNKCKDLKQTCTNKDITFSCVEKSNTDECLTAIKDNKADAITLDGGDVFKGSLHPYDLKPVMAEHYGAETETCYYAVAVVKKSSTFMFNDLKNKKSCHTGIRKTAGWNIIIGALLEKKLLEWAGPDQESIEKAVSRFFTASCVPGATEPNLCQLCIGTEKNKCSRSNSEPYYNYEGAFRCLKDGKGDVAFVKHSTVPKALYADYELLCPDNTRKPINKYKECNLAIVPAHGVVARSHDDKAKDIIEFLETAQKTKECKLFSSDHGKDLLFKDSADHLVTLPPAMDTFLFLGPKYYNAIKYLKDGPALEKSAPSKTKVRWCTQNKGEKTKCDDWTALSGGAIVCLEPFSAEGCITQILKGEADAVALDGGYMYTAGQMGLVPVMGEYYDKDDLTPCEKRSTKTKGTYYAVAIVKKGSKITWNNLKAQKSCHTAVGRTAGWNIPMGLIANKTNSCEFDTFFQEGCAPGAKPNSNLCKLCIGDPSKTLNKAKCSDSGSEGYYGYSGAFRCLVEKGDVCFAKHSTVFENTDGKNPADWAKNLKSTNFELLCPDGSRTSVSDYKTCNLAEVPAHAVVTRPQIRKEVVNVLSNQQSLYGRKGMEKDMFQMFVSNGGKDLLFKDSTQCLLEIPEGTTMEAFLGDQYNTAVTHLNKCSKSALLTAWEFHTCS